MNRKPRIDSVLFQLSEDQQAQVYDWILSLGYEKSRSKLAQPPPEGFSLTTHLASLRRFFLRYSAILQRENAIDELQTQVPPGTFQAAENVLHLHALDLAASPGSIEAFKELSRWVALQKTQLVKEEFLKTAQAQLALARQRLELEREKFQFNAARAALNHRAELGEIMDNDQTDNQDKIDAARSLLFGIPIDQLPK